MRAGKGAVASERAHGLLKWFETAPFRREPSTFGILGQYHSLPVNAREFARQFCDG
jgi:hypothetical protein